MSILDFFDDTKESPPQAEVPTPTLAETLRNAISAHTMELRVCMPGTIIKYDHKTQKVDVKPVFDRKYNDGTVQEAPIIYNVPLGFPRGGKSFLSFPIKTGDHVTLFFADRSIDKWLSNGSRGEPGDTRAHHISDAIAYPGVYPFSDPADVSNPDDAILKNSESEIRMKENGHVQIMNKAFDMIKILDDWMSADISGAHGFKIAIQQQFRTFLEK